VLADPSTASAVRATLDRFIAGYQKGDVDLVVGTLVPDGDLVLIGTAADERRVGIAEARAQFERDLSQSESRSLKVGWTSISSAGNVAWIASDLIVEAVSGGQSTSFPVRLTAVLVETAGDWKFAQAHLSTSDASTTEGHSFPD
jgi:ketosteroid isomerase-like protein